MLNRFAALAACLLIPLGTAPIALAEPPVGDVRPAAGHRRGRVGRARAS